MSGNPDFDELVRADNDYLAAADKLFAGNPVPALRDALQIRHPTPSGRETALRVLRDFGVMRPEVIEALIPQLFELALGLDWRSAMVRQLLSGLDRSVLDRRIMPILEIFLEEDRSPADYWGMIALLDQAGLEELRGRTVEHLIQSRNRPWREVAEQWKLEIENRESKTT